MWSAEAAPALGVLMIFMLVSAPALADQTAGDAVKAAPPCPTSRIATAPGRITPGGCGLPTAGSHQSTTSWGGLQPHSGQGPSALFPKPIPEAR